MIKCNSLFRFYSVGQGLFYSGQLQFNKNIEFNLVYDCGGSSNRIFKEINSFYNSVNKKEIDFLIISHFHQDHINGLNSLLNKFRVKKVFIPYFSFLERLYIGIINKDKVRKNVKWYFDFLDNPIKFLLSRGVEQVIVIQGSEKFDGKEISELPFPEYIDGIEPIIELKYGDKNILNSEDLSAEDRKRTSVYTHQGYVSINNLWLFKFFYNYIPDKNVLGKLRECVRNISFKSIKDALKDDNSLSKVKECYKKLIGEDKLNDSSLVMMHMPLNIKSFGFCFNDNFYNLPVICCNDKYDYEYFIHRWYRCLDLLEDCFEYMGIKFAIKIQDILFNIKESINENGKFSFFAQALTGDVNLNRKFESFCSHFKFFRDKLVLFQLPHHGSKKNWNRRFLKEFFPLVSIASAGLNNRYGHPSKDLLDELNFNGIKTIWVNDIVWHTAKFIFVWELETFNNKRKT